jgi:hypothetical protein
MKQFAASLVAAAALLGSTLAGTALAQDTRVKVASPQAYDAQQGRNDQSNQDRNGNQGWNDQSNQDRSGNQGWNDQSNQDRSGNQGYGNQGYGNQGSGRDQNGYNRGGRGRFDKNILEGSWAADNQGTNYRSDRGNYGGNYRGNYGGHGPMREIMLPDFIRIDQKPSMVRISDSRNQALQLIMLGGKFNSGRGGNLSGRGGNLDYVQGSWHGSTLVVERSTGRGTITQTFALQDRGRTLVVRTRREGNGPRTMEITSTYHRA